MIWYGELLKKIGYDGTMSFEMPKNTVWGKICLSSPNNISKFVKLCQGEPCLDRKWKDLNKEFLNYTIPRCALCEKPIKTDNKTGYCEKCSEWSPQKLAQKNKKSYQPISYCKICQRVIHKSYSKYDYCYRHRDLNPIRKKYKEKNRKRKNNACLSFRSTQ